MGFIRRTLILTSIILYANAAYGWTTAASILTRWIALTTPAAGRPATSAPASTTCYCYPGCGRHNECCSNCKADPFITTPPVRSRCHCRPWCYRYNECCSYCQSWYTTQPAVLTTTTAPVRTRCHCHSSCYWYNECCSYCPSWYTTPSVSHNEYQELNCNFEYGTCGYFQTTVDDFDWTRHQGSTLSSNTGPRGDHTTGTGYYMYIEASGKANYSTARLISYVQDATDNQGLCLSFFYHMYGDAIDTLTVFLSTRENEELIFRRSHTQGYRWWRATAQFRSSQTWRIIFEGRRGTDYKGDIAIDDISIFPGSCPTEDLPATQPEDFFATTVPDRPWCYCDQGCELYNECCSYCPRLNNLTKVVFVDSVYKVTSPNFPGAYPNDLAATWHFSTFEGFQLLLKFQVLATETCCDFVKVGNGNSTDRQVALHWSGGPPESEVRFLSSRNTMWMTFKTDYSVTATGFEASVEVVNIGLSALDCDEFHCVGEGVCIPHSRVCNREPECGWGSEEENCTGWNTGEPDGRPTTSAPASTTCFCYPGCARYNECCSYCKDDLPTTTPPVRSRCHCRSWCYRYNECCSYCQDWYTTQPAVLTTTTAPVRTRCHCRSSCYWYNECCSYCLSWYTTPSVSHNEYQELNCNFEYGTCGYYQRGDDDFDWRRHRGSTLSDGTGPPGDHTTGTGYYMYIETSIVSAFSRARLASYPQNATNDQGLCLSFFYHMYGDTINTLNVYLSSGGNEDLIFRRSRNQGYRWWRATAQFGSSSTWRIIFEGRTGTSFTGDIAIDDISIFPSSCPTEDLSATQPDLSTTQPGWYTTPSDSTHSTKVVFVDSNYTFTSPNFPGAYPNNLTARWHFSTFEGFRLLLKFQVLVTEACCDSVKVGNGNSTDRQLVFSWGGGPPESEVRFLSSGNKLWMTFKTDFSVTATGFEASVEVVNISSSALDCDGFHCVSEGVCIPYDRVCYLTKCTSAPTNLCFGWNTEEAGWYTEEPGSIWATEDPLDEIILHCEPTSFQVDLPVQILPIDMQPSDFFLSGDPFDPSCRGFRNGDHFFSLNSSLTRCGTIITETETFISYRNLVAYTRNTSRVVEHYIDELPVQCDYDRSKQLQSHFVIDESSQRIKRAKGSFLYDFSMYTDMSFDVRYYSYPVETTSDRYLYFRAELLQSPDNLRIHLRSCRATPSQNFDDAVVFEFIHDGCVIDDANVRVLTPSSPVQADFMIQSFRFRPDLSNYTSQVWIHCEVVVCDVNDQSSECLHDCERSRRRRSVAESSKEATRLIQGPIFFTDTEDLDQKSGSFLLMEEREEFIIFTVALTIVCLVMFLTLVVVGWALFKIMRRVKRMEYRPPQNERYSTL